MKRLLSLLAVLALGTGLAACGDDDDDPTVGDDDAAETTSTTEDAEAESTTTMATAAPDGDAVVVAAGETSAGTHLTVEGMTVYLFTQDPEGGDSACTGGCLETWPPLEAAGEVAAGDGVDESLLGTAPLADGGEQVTYNGHRLYFFANDASPGDANGQGVGDVWFVVSPEGDAIS